ncbi:MAG TPA: DUF1343 domain-containing protein [Candidatus Aminicenantes bacterium]|nr:DUF1343 domain-containing protein [Candidatus Aminicenantes bacterium]HRY65643.1 DUF1343 domain-containing protein [Candidatus Aminicenantes bacterium]HRZ72469.1 DUF1343 domain-containing protein [Candidatus Aminicenantes bacterium]
MRQRTDLAAGGRRGRGPAARLALAAGLAAVLGLALASCAGRERPAGPGTTAAAARVKPGVEVFLEKHLDLVKGKRVGLITNQTGTDAGLRSTVELFQSNPAIRLVALYGPEHGVRGDAQAGVYVPFYYDQAYKLPVFSLYGQSFKPDPGMLRNIDEYMRSFDTREAGKVPEGGMVKDVDVLVFDIQDVGTRVYTYVATMAYAMQAAAEAGLDFIVLDRPAPINGVDMEGAILEYPELSSFIGLFPIPLRFGMTAGELARLFNDKFLARTAKLTVIPVEGWSRSMWFDETGLPWVIPSPNMPTLDTATVYPGLVAIEGTNLSEGRGTTRPFELFGAPWLDGHALAARLNALGLPGVRFREAWFTPSFSKFQGELCGGCQIHVTDRTAFRPVATVLHIIRTVRDAAPGKFAFHADYFDKVMGTASVRKALEAGTDVAAILESMRPGLESFAALRRAYLLY